MPCGLTCMQPHAKPSKASLKPTRRLDIRLTSVANGTARSLRILTLDRLTNLRQITASDLADVLLPRLLPAYWRGKRDVVWDVRVPGQPSEEWVEHLWENLQARTCPATATLSACMHLHALGEAARLI